jgi:hypothetical protein
LHNVLVLLRLCHAGGVQPASAPGCGLRACKAIAYILFPLPTGEGLSQGEGPSPRGGG